MGQKFDKDTFNSNDFKRFNSRIHRQLHQLKQIINKDGFSSGQHSYGAELELYLLNDDFSPKCCNQTLLALADNPLLTDELNQYNLEINLAPIEATPDVFSQMQKSLQNELNKLDTISRKNGINILPIGILPTLKECHLSIDHMTDIPRYRALTEQLANGSEQAFNVDINGIESLKMQCDEVTLEGANTSFQVHFKVSAEQFADYYNAAQLTTPLVLAIAANSPIFLGKKLWHETRIALFKQSIDNRTKELTEWRQPARVSFGQGWLRHSAWELFAENVSLYPPLLPYNHPDKKPFAELLLHHGTVWSWNRAVFDNHDNPHLRIEYRSLPAGPTAIDMTANAALSIGLTVAFSKNIDEYLVKLPFQHAEYNFYRAAKHGIDAKILWPSLKQNKLGDAKISDILIHTLSAAVEGLISIGIDHEEAQYFINIIKERIERKQTGATWQLNYLKHKEKSQNKHDAMLAMLKTYQSKAQENIPVAEW